MMPLTHLLMAFILSYFITKNWKYRAVMAFGGIIPDIDAVHILFDIEKYYQYHHVLAHPPFMGLAIGVLAVSFFYYVNRFANANISELKKFKFERLAACKFFMAGFLVHVFGDVIGTDWPVNLLYPFGVLDVTIADYVSVAAIYQINVLFTFASLVAVMLILLNETYIKRRH